jgi:hypothetical protein
MSLRAIAAAVLGTAAMLVVAACGGGDSSGTEASGTFAVGDCAVSVDPETSGEVEKLDCSDSSAEFKITGVAASLNELGSCDSGVQVGDQAVCLEAVGANPDSATAEQGELDYSTLEPGDCTDASVEDPGPTQVLPCDDPRAKSEVLGQASDPLDCKGDVAAQRNGVVVCMRSL